MTYLFWRKQFPSNQVAAIGFVVRLGSTLGGGVYSEYETVSEEDLVVPAEEKGVWNELITQEEVQKAINKLGRRKATGGDELEIEYEQGV